MKFNKKYRIVVEDESSLQKKVDFSTRFLIILLVALGALLIVSAIGMLVFAYSPLKNHLPGYLKESERTATEEQHLRLDSLSTAYEVNQAYINGILNALNPPQTPQKDTLDHKPVPLKLDSLLPLSNEEKEFMEAVRERDKYNIPYTSSAAAQTMMFGSVNDRAVVTEATKNNYQAEMIVPAGAPISSIAEGKVISVASSPRYSGAFEIIIQHPKGFLSKTSRLTNLVVNPGDNVSQGQIIALGTSKDGARQNHVYFELWHDGDPLIPSEYLKSATPTSISETNHD